GKRVGGRNGGAGRSAPAPVGTPVSWLGAGRVGRGGTIGPAGSAAPSSGPTDLGVHSSHPGGRALRVPGWSAPGSQLERHSEPGRRRLRRGLSAIGCYEFFL